jgi:Fe2+ transport system protein FeoA
VRSVDVLTEETVMNAAPTPSAQPDEALIRAPSGATARIARIGLDAGTRRHLAALGIRNGALIDIVRNLGADGVVVGLAEDRLSLPRDLAQAIRVVPIWRSPGGHAASHPESRP